jgi:hypothetical protein
MLPYVPALGHPFFADDWIHLERATEAAARPSVLLRAWVLEARDASAWWTPPDLAIRYFRPLASWAFVVDRALWGLSPFGFHLTNILLHAVATLLAYAVGRRVLPTTRAAWLGAALFALHPCHAGAVAWISARADLLCGLFYLAALLFHLRARQEGRPAWWAVAAACLGLSLLAKEMAVSFPLVVLLEVLVFPRGEPLSRRLRGPVVAGAVVAAYLVWRRAVVGPMGLPPRPFALEPGDPGFVGQVFMTLLQYLADLVLFVPADPVITLPFWQGHPVVFGLVATAAAAVLLSTLRAVTDRRLRAFGLAFIAIALVPVLPVAVGEHFLYVPSVGYCLLVGAKLSPHGTENRGRLAALAVLVAGVALARTLAFGVVARAARQSIDDALAAWDAAPRVTALLIVDLPGPAALGFGHALRLARPERPPRLEILAMSPRALPDTRWAGSRIEGRGADRLIVRRDEPMLGSYIERAFAGEHGPFAPGDRVQRGAVTVTVRDARQGRPLALEVSLAEPGEPPLLLRAEGYRLRAMAWPSP